MRRKLSLRDRFLNVREETIDFSLGAMMFGWEFVFKPALIVTVILCVGAIPAWKAGVFVGTLLRNIL